MKAGKQRPAAEIDHLGAGTLVQALDVATAAGRDDDAIPDGDRLHRRLRIVHGEDVATGVDGIGRRWRIGAKRRATT